MKSWVYWHVLIILVITRGDVKTDPGNSQIALSACSRQTRDLVLNKQKKVSGA